MVIRGRLKTSNRKEVARRMKTLRGRNHRRGGGVEGQEMFRKL